MDLNVNASPITQVATTTAVGGPGILGERWRCHRRDEPGC